MPGLSGARRGTGLKAFEKTLGLGCCVLVSVALGWKGHRLAFLQAGGWAVPRCWEGTTWGCPRLAQTAHPDRAHSGSLGLPGSSRGGGPDVGENRSPSGVCSGTHQKPPPDTFPGSGVLTAPGCPSPGVRPPGDGSLVPIWQL